MSTAIPAGSEIVSSGSLPPLAIPLDISINYPLRPHRHRLSRIAPQTLHKSLGLPVDRGLVSQVSGGDRRLAQSRRSRDTDRCPLLEPLDGFLESMPAHSFLPVYHVPSSLFLSL